MIFHIHPVYTQLHCGTESDDNNIYCTNEKDVNCPVCVSNMSLSDLNLMFSFPRAKFVDENLIMKQIKHIQSELNEVEQSAMTPDVHHTAVELWDLIHSCETGLRILAKSYGADPKMAKSDAIKKNRDRGYYVR